jgi:hypothetical protein
MTKQEVIEKFCELSGTVGDHLINKFSSDCFCGNNPISDENFLFELDIIIFIQNAVSEKINREKENKS